MKMFDEFAELVDEIDNVNHALMLDMPDKIHVGAIRSILPDFVKRLQEILNKNNDSDNEALS